MRVCYNIHSHRDPDQIAHLVETITQGSPDCLVVLNHDQRGAQLDEPVLTKMGDVVIQKVDGGYADFSHVDRWYDCAAWLRKSGAPFDWLVNITGQDYPLRPMSAIEADLAAATVDGFIEYFPAFGPGRKWPERRARSRYLFHHRTLRTLTPDGKRRLHRLQAINFVQPLVRVHVAYGLTVGWRVRSPFGPGLELYGGSAFMSLNRRSVDYLWDFRIRRADLVNHFRQTLSPVEAYFQTALVNAPGLTFTDDCKRYFDFRGSEFNHPRTLDASDVPAALASGADFGRKFDLTRDPDAIAQLDAVVRLGAAG